MIGGTGFEQLPPDIFAERMEIDTRFGKAVVLSVSNNYVEPYKLYFLSRHGAEHGLAPHQINYRANIAALVELDVKYVYATNAVGSLKTDIQPGSLVLIDDFLDCTRHRPLSYFSDGENWKHIDFTNPYSAILREYLISAALGMGIELVQKGVYLCCDGPRFESPAEVKLFGSWGADVVGMTGLPEAIFAKEAGLEYSALCLVTNLGAGLSSNPISHEEVVSMMQEKVGEMRELLLNAGGLLIAETQK